MATEFFRQVNQDVWVVYDSLGGPWSGQRSYLTSAHALAFARAVLAADAATPCPEADVMEAG